MEYGREPRAIDVLYDRAESTACSVRPEDAPWEAVSQASAFFVSGITPALSPATRDLALALAEAARRHGRLVVTDLNYRARLWSVEQAAPVLSRLASLANVVIVTEDDVRALWQLEGEPEPVARELHSRFGCDSLVLTRGSQGGLLLEKGELRQAGIFPTTRIDRIGAGDAFAAGFLWARLTGRGERALEYALALAALKHSVPGDTLSSSVEELERIVSRQLRDIRR